MLNNFIIQCKFTNNCWIVCMHRRLFYHSNGDSLKPSKG